MKITDLKFLAIALLAVTFSFTLNSCSDDDDDKKGEEVNYTLSLASEDDALLELPTDQLVDTVVHITTNAPAELIKVEAVENNGSWCTAKVLNNTTISVKAGIHTESNDRTATFKITVPGAEPVEFTITQLGTDTQNTITLSGVPMVNDIYSYTAPYKDGAPFSFIIKTNAARWNIEIEDYNDWDDSYIPWYSINKTSGRSGETVEIQFTQANETGMMRNIMLNISAGTAEPVSISIMQNPKPATEITVWDADWETTIANNTLLSFNASDISTSRVEYGIEANGSIDVAICTAGTSNPITEEESWLNASYGIYGNVVISPKSANTTGTDRKLDVVLKGGDVELFRIPVVQKAN
ncbi:MAG: BACON domain-containing protein [Coprobacter sp.]|uniref:BACON domain-containing protein n=1 Tax=uncultured Coprobacter sp. TaxID=1720550 RepID=UPI002639F8BE|nr:BACON domain-containing carbohydrate-binding protein [uncultured Coprobacter sp.]